MRHWSPKHWRPLQWVLGQWRGRDDTLPPGYAHLQPDALKIGEPTYHTTTSPHHATASADSAIIHTIIRPHSTRHKIREGQWDYVSAATTNA